jgi:hypothetical protein
MVIMETGTQQFLPGQLERIDYERRCNEVDGAISTYYPNGLVTIKMSGDRIIRTSVQLARQAVLGGWATLVIPDGR